MPETREEVCNEQRICVHTHPTPTWYRNPEEPCKLPAQQWVDRLLDLLSNKQAMLMYTLAHVTLQICWNHKHVTALCLRM